MEIKLDDGSRRLANEAGRRRYERRRRSGSLHRWNRNQSEHTVEAEVESIGAEIACANVVGWKWVDTDTPDREGDIGAGRQVRHTRVNNGYLLLHEEDSDDHTYFLVTGRFPIYTVRGFISGKDGKHKRFWEERKRGRPCFWVGQEYLTPFMKDEETDDGWCEICSLTPGQIRSVEGGCYKMMAGKECEKLNVEVRRVHLLESEGEGGSGGGLPEVSSDTCSDRAGEGGVESKPSARHKLLLFPYGKE